MRYCRKPAGTKRAVSRCVCGTMETMYPVLAVRPSWAVQIATRLLSASTWLPLHARRWLVRVSIRHERRLSVASSGGRQRSGLRRPRSTRPCGWRIVCFTPSVVEYSSFEYVATQSLHIYLCYLGRILQSMITSVLGIFDWWQFFSSMEWIEWVCF